MTVGIVTGAGRGMGAACAERMADMVDVLVLVDRDEVLLATQADMLAAAGHRAQVEPFVLDVKDPGGIARLAARVAELGPLRAVAHAAGLSPTMADWREILTVNLVGTARLVEACRVLAVPETAVVCFASVAALLALDQGDLPPDAVLDDPLADGFLEKIREAVGPEIEDPGMAYTWSKRGVHRLVRREAVRFGQVGARICSVTPGMIDTPMGRQEAEARDTSAMLVDMSPLHREGRPEEVAAGAVFLLSDEASFISGIDLPVDGGLVAAIRGGGGVLRMSTVVNVKNLLDPGTAAGAGRVRAAGRRRRGRGRHAVGVLRLAGPLRRGGADRARGARVTRLSRCGCTAPRMREGLLPAIVTIHGGGYVIGSYDMDGPLLDRWCPALGVVGVSVEYRLAPETPYPGPLEDCYAALRWTYDNADELGIDKERIGLYGLSAGGGLAAALALLARDRGEVPLAFVAPRLPDARRPPADALHPGRGALRVGRRRRTSSAGAPISATSTAPTRSRPTLPRPGRPTWPASLRRAWSWAPSTASATRTSTTPSA